MSRGGKPPASEAFEHDRADAAGGTEDQQALPRASQATTRYKRGNTT